MNNRITQLLSFLFLFTFITAANAATPQNISYQGVLTDSITSVPISGPVNIVVRLFDAATGGTQLYSEEHNGVVPDEAVFVLDLGGGSTPTGTFDGSTFANNTTWLELEIGGETLAPRQAFLSVPYALHSENAVSATDADTLDGNDSTAISPATIRTSPATPPISPATIRILGHCKIKRSLSQSAVLRCASPVPI